MSGRTPSFIVVGLVIIMFLLGLFYMSCSSKNNELRQSLEEFEDRIRSLTMKNGDYERKIENINTRKRELEEEKSNVQRQMEKKDSEINDLNTRINKKEAELQSIRSDKQALDEQLKDYRTMRETLSSKDALIEKMRQQIDEGKRSKGTDDSELIRLRDEIKLYKQQLSQRNPTDDAQQQPQVPKLSQRFPPLGSNNENNGTSGLFLRGPIQKLSNMPDEIGRKLPRAAQDIGERMVGALGADGQASSPAQQQGGVVEARQANQLADQNVPAPPLANNAQLQQQPGHVESAQIAPGAAALSHEKIPDQAPPPADNSPFRQSRSVTEVISNNNHNNNDNNSANNKTIIDDDDEQQLDEHDNEPAVGSPSNRNALGNPHPVVAPPRSADKEEQNYRIGNRDQPLNDAVDEQQQRQEHGEEELDNLDHHQHKRAIDGKRNLL